MSVINEEKKLEYLIEDWKKTIEVQQHFNQICLTLRSLAITVLGTGIGAISFLVKENFIIILFGYQFYPIGWLFLLLSFIWFAFYFFDRYWYHKFLTGTTNHAKEIEQKIQIQIPEWKLSESIGKASDIVVSSKVLNWILKNIFRKNEFRSTDRLDVFYRSFLYLLIFLTLLSFFNQRLLSIGKNEGANDIYLKVDSLHKVRDSLMLLRIEQKIQESRVVIHDTVFIYDTIESFNNKLQPKEIN